MTLLLVGAQVALCGLLFPAEPVDLLLGILDRSAEPLELTLLFIDR